MASFHFALLDTDFVKKQFFKRFNILKNVNFYNRYVPVNFGEFMKQYDTILQADKQERVVLFLDLVRNITDDFVIAKAYAPENPDQIASPTVSACLTMLFVLFSSEVGQIMWEQVPTYQKFVNDTCTDLMSMKQYRQVARAVSQITI